MSVVYTRASFLYTRWVGPECLRDKQVNHSREAVDFTNNASRGFLDRWCRTRQGMAISLQPSVRLWWRMWCPGMMRSSVAMSQSRPRSGRRHSTGPQLRRCLGSSTTRLSVNFWVPEHLLLDFATGWQVCVSLLCPCSKPHVFV